MFPEEFLKRIEGQLGEEYPAFLQSMERPRAVALRFNPLKGTQPQLSFARENVPWEKMGYYYDPNSRPGLHPYHDAGVYYLQEASAMAPVALLQPQPGDRVCDLCAAPGGKTTQIAGYLKGEGFLLCNEINPKRAKILSRNVERLGVANALTTNEHPKILAKHYEGYFDKVLIDAPCSGEGMFRKEEAAVTDWSPETVQMCARRQAEILGSGAKLLRPGGRLVYSTCTFAPEENEEAIAQFLQSHPDFSLENTEAPWFVSEHPGMYRLWPHKLLGEGHFVAVLKKAGEAYIEPPVIREEKPCKPLSEFLSRMEISLPKGRFLQFGQSVYWAPVEMPDIRGVKVLRPGLELGELKKDRFEPAHALAMWLKNAGNTQNFAADSEEIVRYLHGETVPTEVKGWCLVTVDGYTLGWGKGDGNILKNHYPKGLRR